MVLPEKVFQSRCVMLFSASVSSFVLAKNSPENNRLLRFETLQKAVSAVLTGILLSGFEDLF
jgi:hypothetical protein